MEFGGKIRIIDESKVKFFERGVLRGLLGQGREVGEMGLSDLPFHF